MANRNTGNAHQRIPHRKIRYSPNTTKSENAEVATHAPRPVKDTEKPRALPRSGKKK